MLGKPCLLLGCIQAWFSGSYLLVVGLRYPCGSDVLLGLRIPGLHQWFSNFVPHPQFLTQEHEPGLTFAFCTNFPHFGVAAIRRLPFKK